MKELYPEPMKAVCFPNPFKEGITLEVTLSMTEEFTIEVFDQTGQRIRQVMGSTRITEGTHSFIWDGANDQGQPVTTGIYYIKVTGREKPLIFKVVRSEK
jgi:flagellar hook assembly protein FlgD